MKTWEEGRTPAFLLAEGRPVAALLFPPLQLAGRPPCFLKQDLQSTPAPGGPAAHHGLVGGTMSSEPEAPPPAAAGAEARPSEPRLGGRGGQGSARKLLSEAHSLWSHLCLGDPALKGRHGGSAEALRVCWGPFPLLLNFNFLAAPCNMWDLSSPTRDQIYAP